MMVLSFLAACATGTADPAGTDTAAADSGADTADTGGGGDTGDTTDTGGDTDTDDTHDTAINDPDTGADAADITGAYNGTSFVMNIPDAPNAEILCQDSGDYLLRLQDPAGRYQFAMNVSQPVAGTTVSYPSLGSNTFQLGEVNTWLLDSTYHGTVSSAHITVDAFKPTIRVTGSFEITWVADGAGNPSANASGTFDLGCR